MSEGHDQVASGNERAGHGEIEGQMWPQAHNNTVTQR